MAFPNFAHAFGEMQAIPNRSHLQRTRCRASALLMHLRGPLRFRATYFLSPKITNPANLGCVSAVRVHLVVFTTKSEKRHSSKNHCVRMDRLLATWNAEAKRSKLELSIIERNRTEVSAKALQPYDEISGRRQRRFRLDVFLIGLAKQR